LRHDLRIARDEFAEMARHDLVVDGVAAARPERNHRRDRPAFVEFLDGVVRKRVGMLKDQK